MRAAGVNAPARWSRGDAFTAGAAARRLDLQLPTQISPSAGYKPRIASKTPIRTICRVTGTPGRDTDPQPMMLGLQDVVEQQQDGYSSLTVGQLKDLLRERGLKVSGVKSDLVARLAEASETNPSSISGTSANISLGGNLGPPGKALHGDVDVGDVDGIARLMMRAGVSVPESYISGRARKAQGSPNEQQKAVQSNLSRNNPGVTADSADSKLFSEGGGSSRGIPSRGGRAGKSRSRADSNKRDPWREKVWHERGSDVPPLKVPGLVMVEGRFDARAVERAVMAQAVFPLQEMAKTHGRGAEYRRRIKEMATNYDKVFLLLDPDNTGNQLRVEVAEIVSHAFHAFIPVKKCSAKEATIHHEVGNVGVEHAEPFDIQASLLRARVARPERREFSLEELIEWGLAGVHGEGPQERWAAYGGVSTRRRLVAEALGLHDGSAKVLLKNLNQFFRREEVEDALAGLPGPGEDIPVKMTDGIADELGGRSSLPPGSCPASFPMYPMKK